jgi:hypothetical protein
MLPLDDSKWSTLEGGYRVAYDASVPLRNLERGDAPNTIWEELWNELHHQGDVGIASYAAVPQLTRIARVRNVRDWNLYALVSTIESARHDAKNPPIPGWLETSYREAWRDLLDSALRQLGGETDELTTRAILGVIALAKGLTQLGRLISDFDASEIQELYDEVYGRNG